MIDSDVLKKVLEFTKSHAPVVVPILLMIWTYITTTLSLAIAQADKDNDGYLTNEEMEELVIYLVKNSKTLWIKALPEGLIRRIVRRLCTYRKKAYGNVINNNPLSSKPSIAEVKEEIQAKLEEKEKEEIQKDLEVK